MRESHSIWHEGSFRVGLTLTVIVACCFFYLLAYIPVEEDGKLYTSKWDYLKKAAPNEIGDTISGVAGSLALVWIIVAVLLQAKELAEQRVEISKMAKAQEQQVKLLSQQGEIFQQEQDSRKQRYASEKLQRLLEGLAFSIDRESRRSSLHGRYFPELSRLHIFAPRTNEPLDEYILMNSEKVSDFFIVHDGEYADGQGQFAGWIGYYEAIEGYLQKISKLSIELPEDQNQRLENMRFQKLNSDIQSLVHNGPWSDDSYRPEIGEE